MCFVLSNLQWFTRYDLRIDYPFLGWPSSYRLTVTERRLWETQLATYYYSGDFTATSARSWAALYGVGCLGVRAGRAVSLCVSRAQPLGMFISCLCKRRDHSGRYRLWPGFVPTKSYKTCVSLVELGRTSRHFIVHFENEKIPTKKFPRYRRCAFCQHKHHPQPTFPC